MSYAAYAEVKPSGVVWLGRVPAHWQVKMLKRASPVKRGASPRPIDDSKYFDEEGEFAWVRIADVTASDTYLEHTTQRLSELGASLSVKMQPGALFLSIAGSVGKPCITRIKCCIHDGFVYFPKLTADPKFIFYLFAAGEAYKGLGKLGTQLNLNTDTVGEIQIGFPPLPEQQQIAAFLDRKTAELDAVLRLKERQLELLAEKRQALISQAVTRGLDPTAPLKPSGIPWLGDVPEHWEVSRLKYVSQIISGQSPHESTYNTNGIGVVLINGPAEYSEADFGLTVEAKWTTDPIRWAPKGCLLFCLRGSTTGRLNITHAEVSIGRGVAAIVAHEDQAFINYLMVTLRAAVVGTSNGSTFPSVTSETLGNYYLALPSFPEQKAIVAYLDRETARMDGIAQAIRTQIDRVREYRQALISAAVTGKIDVRGEANAGSGSQRGQAG